MSGWGWCSAIGGFIFGCGAMNMWMHRRWVFRDRGPCIALASMMVVGAAMAVVAVVAS